MSEDADLIVKMWKEKRLTEMFCQVVCVDGDENDCLEVKPINQFENNDVIQTEEENNDKLVSTKTKKKGLALCCSVM